MERKERVKGGQKTQIPLLIIFSDGFISLWEKKCASLRLLIHFASFIPLKGL